MENRKLTNNQANDLRELNSKKFQQYQEIMIMTNESNQDDLIWWNDVYKSHNLNPNISYEIEWDGDDAYIKKVENDG